MNIGEGALVNRTTQLSRDALTRALNDTDVHLPDTIPDPRGQLLRTQLFLYTREGAEKIFNGTALGQVGLSARTVSFCTQDTPASS